MEIPVIVEPVEGEYRARCRHPIDLNARGHTRFEATQALEVALKAQISVPFELLVLEPSHDQPWIGSAGSIEDDETTDLWLDAIAEYRRECDLADQSNSLPIPDPQPAP